MKKVNVATAPLPVRKDVKISPNLTIPVLVGDNRVILLHRKPNDPDREFSFAGFAARFPYAEPIGLN